MRVAIIISIFVLYMLVVLAFRTELLSFFPKRRVDRCTILQYTIQNSMEKWQLTNNNVFWGLINWLENVVIYQVWRKLKRINQNQLNIKNEFFIIVVTWTVFTVIAFVL